jgi:hypothetical protein
VAFGGTLGFAFGGFDGLRLGFEGHEFLLVHNSRVVVWMRSAR